MDSGGYDTLSASDTSYTDTLHSSAISDTLASLLYVFSILSFSLRHFIESSFKLLDICKDIERRLGRLEHPLYDENGKRIYTSRPIDIDILLFGDNKIDCPELTVPHKLMYERDFVMLPLKEIAGQSGDDLNDRQ